MELLSKLSPNIVAFLLGLWPPFWFTGIRFMRIAPDYRHILVQMKLRFYNKNIIGIQYGGNLFSMSDPCYMMMLMANMGRDYHSIDKSASIDFIKLGTTSVFANCVLTQDDIDDIIEHTAGGEKYLKHFSINVVDSNNELIATVNRVVYIRKKNISPI